MLLINCPENLLMGGNILAFRKEFSAQKLIFLPIIVFVEISRTSSIRARTLTSTETSVNE